MPTIEKRNIFGLNISVLTRFQALNQLETHISEGTPLRLAFVNANLANVAYENEGIRNMLGDFLLLNDGSGINFASKLLYGKSFPDNLNGTDFVPFFLDRCQVPLRVFLLGASPAVATRTAALFVERWPRLSLVGYQHGFFPGTEENQVIEKIKAAMPSLVLVAMGNGLQERWVKKLVPEIALSAWGGGAIFDFLSGKVHRAPVWMRWLGIEWLYRLLKEPGRMWRRYMLGNPKFVARVLCELGLRIFGGLKNK